MTVSKTFDNKYTVKITSGHFDKYGKIYRFKVEVYRKKELRETTFVMSSHQAVDIMEQVSEYRDVKFEPFKK